MHADGLRAAASDGALWELHYTSVPRPEIGEAERYIEIALAAHAAGQAMPMVVRDAEGVIVGCTRYYDLDLQVPRLKIGYTWYAKRMQRTALNTEAKKLLLGHAFEQWRCAAVALETSHENLVSRAAIARLGAKQDGILRAHMRHRDGTLRDTVVFSILSFEWPEVKNRLDQKLQAYAND